MGTQAEQGGLLGVPDALGQYTYHVDVYNHNICKQGAGPDDLCTVQSLSGLSAGEISEYEQGETPMPSWSDAANLPSAPPGLTVDFLTGEVTWVTGASPFEEEALAPGFYNLVLAVEERPAGTNYSTTDDPLVRAGGVKARG